MPVTNEDAIIIIDTAPDTQPDTLEFVPDTGCPWDEILEGEREE